MKLYQYLESYKFWIIFSIAILLTLGIIYSFQANATIDTNTSYYTIILNDVPEAMPAEGGYLQVDFFRNDTAFVSSVD